MVKIPASALQNTDNQLVIVKIRDTVSLLQSPVPEAPVKRVLSPGSSVGVKGTFNGYTLVVSEGTTGWLQLPAQRPM
jgi:hypothetical protein